MAVPVDNSGGVVGDRTLIEDAAKLLIAAAPADWTHLRGEFEPAAQPPIAFASVTTASGEPQPLIGPSELFSVVAEHQRRAAAAGIPWRQLVIDCHSDGRLSTWTDTPP